MADGACCCNVDRCAGIIRGRQLYFTLEHNCGCDKNPVWFTSGRSKTNINIALKIKKQLPGSGRRSKVKEKLFLVWFL